MRLDGFCLLLAGSRSAEVGAVAGAVPGQGSSQPATRASTSRGRGVTRRGCLGLAGASPGRRTADAASASVGTIAMPAPDAAGGERSPKSGWGHPLRRICRFFKNHPLSRAGELLHCKMPVLRRAWANAVPLSGVEDNL